MNKHHPYVFDETKLCFAGKFEEMYQTEKEKGFDSWYQDDVRHLDKNICLNILDDFNFRYILDVGCGKGAFTQFLKKKNHKNHAARPIVATTKSRPCPASH